MNIEALAVKEQFIDVRDGDRRPVTELLAALRIFHPNILIIGSGIDVEPVLAQIRPTLLTRSASWSPAETPDPPTGGYGSLVVRGIERLTTSQQKSLAMLLNQSAGDLQVVSIAGLPIFPLVRQGVFLEDLYYRLNVVLLEPGRDGSYGW